MVDVVSGSRVLHASGLPCSRGSLELALRICESDASCFGVGALFLFKCALSVSERQRLRSQMLAGQSRIGMTELRDFGVYNSPARADCFPSFRLLILGQLQILFDLGRFLFRTLDFAR